MYLEQAKAEVSVCIFFLLIDLTRVEFAIFCTKSFTYVKTFHWTTSEDFLIFFVQSTMTVIVQ